MEASEEKNVYQKVALLDEAELSNGRLRRYLTQILGRCPDSLNSASVYSSDLKRLFRMLDFLENSNTVLQKLEDGAQNCAPQEFETEPVKKARAEHSSDPHEAPSGDIKP